MISSGRVPERGVQEAADARPRVVCGMLGRLPDQPGERDERQRGEDEQRDVAEFGEVVDGDDERPEREQGVEHAADQGGATLSSATCCAPFSSTGGTRSSTSPTTRSFSRRAGEAGLATLERDGLPGAGRDGGGLPGALPAAALRPGLGRGGRVPGDDPRAPRRLRRRPGRRASSTASSPPSTRPGNRRGSWAPTRTPCSTRSASAASSPGSSPTPSTQAGSCTAISPPWDWRSASTPPSSPRRSACGSRTRRCSRRRSRRSESSRKTRSSSATAATRTCGARKSSE